MGWELPFLGKQVVSRSGLEVKADLVLGRYEVTWDYPFSKGWGFILNPKLVAQAKGFKGSFLSLALTFYQFGNSAVIHPALAIEEAAVSSNCGVKSLEGLAHKC
ncbi:hypothetical protein FNV43_RR07350 [Rhamnella rubrinervis]|uniref:Uncharacterized protein n=1 Tax=Rhamnella rubrinervis TaxID=2594499 RepID=A0A8K0HF67_9ROSA|nr:hypothetical protein FNV43_RR07350 [Rhamnella rubrinervis]